MEHLKIKNMKKILSVLSVVTLPISIGVLANPCLNHFDSGQNLDDTQFANSVRPHYANAATLNNSATNANLKIVPNVANINSFSDYHPIYSGPAHQIVSTSIGTLGISKDMKTIILTAYNGVVAWSNNVGQTSIVKSFLSSLGVTNTDNYVVKSWLNIEDQYLGVLLSPTPTNGNTTTNQPNITFALELQTGEIFTPKVDNIGNPIPSKNIVSVHSAVNTLVNSSATGSYFALPMGNVTQNDILGTISLISINDQGVSGLDLRNRKVSARDTDKILAFIPGPIGSNRNYLLTYSPYVKQDTQKTFGLYAITNQFWNIVKGTNSIEGYYIAKGLFNIDSFADDTTKSEEFFNNFTRQGIFVGDRSVNSTNFTMLLPKCGDTVESSGFLGLRYENNNVTFTNYNTFNTASPSNTGIEQSRMVAVVGNKAFYSTKKTSANTLIGQIDMSNPSAPVFTNIKQSTTEAQKANPWLFAPVKGANGDAYVYMDPSSLGNIYYEYKTNNTWSSPVTLSFNKYNDPVAAIKQDNVIYKKIVNGISDSELISKLNFHNSSLKNTYTITIANRVNTPLSGVLEFDYKIDTVAWWNNRQKVTFYLHVKVDGFYSLNKINLSFITSPTDDQTKYNQITTLKQTKYASQITKNDVLNYFIKSDITNKDGAKVTITDSMITLNHSVNHDSLTITVTLPTNIFPAGINLFPSLTTKTYTYTGFLSYGGYSSTINTVASDSLKAKYPSEITFIDIINEVVNLGFAYSKAQSDWDCQYTYDDLNGSLTIKRLVYTKVLNPALPENVKNLIVNPITITGLKNTLDLFTLTPTINNIPKTETVGTTIKQIWESYKKAVDSKDTVALQRSLIYKSLNNNVTLNKDDLILNVTNLDTADQDGELRFTATIKSNAVLVYKKGNDNIIFDASYESKVQKELPNTYPFKLVQKIDVEKYDVNFNDEITSNSPNITTNEDNNIVINLDDGNWNEISNSMLVSDFAINFESYQQNILDLFVYTNNYKPVISKPIINETNGTAIFQVEFIPTVSQIDETNRQIHNNYSVNHKNNAVTSFSTQIIVSGFKINSSPALNIIPIIIVIVVALILLILFIYIFIRTKKGKKLNEYKFTKPSIDNKKKYLGSQQVIVETSNPLGTNYKVEVKDQVIDNSKPKTKKWL